MENTPDSEAAVIEAWEEAGVKRIKSDPMHCGSLRYNKVMKDGTDQLIEMQLFSFETAKLSKNFPERGQRKLRWVGVNIAIRKLKQPELKPILKRLNVKPDEIYDRILRSLRSYKEFVKGHRWARLNLKIFRL